MTTQPCQTPQSALPTRPVPTGGQGRRRMSPRSRRSGARRREGSGRTVLDTLPPLRSCGNRRSALGCHPGRRAQQ
jgi:hypothetical protein